MFRRKEEGSETGGDLMDNANQNNNNNANASDSYIADPTRGAATTPASAGAAAAPGQPYKAPVRTMQQPEPTALGAGAGYRPTVTTPTAANRGPEGRAGAGMMGDKTKSNRSVLTVGHGIELKGEIATCDRLVIEGQVDATLNNVHTMEIAEGGSFKGAAKIEEAEISGLFDGDLEVRGRLIIYSTGKVRGKISYGEIEVERGGQLTGEIKIIGDKSASSYDKNDKKSNAA